MGDATYQNNLYRDNDGNRLVASTGARIHVDGGVLQYNVREAAIYSSCGDLPYSGVAFLGNSSAAIVHYVLPTPDADKVGSVLTLHFMGFDDTVSNSSHFYVETSSGISYAVGITTATNAIIFDSTYEYPFTINLQMASTNLYKAMMPGTTGALATGLLLGTTLTT
jgi:hypothetical protein